MTSLWWLPTTLILSLLTYLLQKIISLGWQTQFHVVLLSHGLLGLVDEWYPPSPSTVTSSDGESYLNLKFQNWRRLDQSVRHWLFATLSPEVLVETGDSPISYHAWDKLMHRALKHGSCSRT